MSLLSRLAVQAARAYGMLVGGASTNVPASYLVVAGGGGGGGAYYAGGGGAGGYQTSTFTLSTLNTYSITVGAGGNGGANGVNGAQGSNSVVSGTGLTTVTSVGGGYGSWGGTSNPGGNGGSGGGAGNQGGSGGTATSGQGNNGGSCVGNLAGGGGGGASAAGTNSSSAITGANGGNGSASSISGSSVTYAGGGGGGGITGSGGTGGTGGGGNGGAQTTAPTAGTANLGGGGGGCNGNSGAFLLGANGGSGIVIISYTSATPKFVGGTLTTSGGNQIHTFTSSGTLSPITPVTASYLVVAGGAGGGGATTNQGGGGGGAGGLQASSTTLYSGATYVVTVGAGGTGGVYGGAAAGAGSNSVVSGTGLTTLTSVGGGGGGVGPDANGSNGGSGGGGGSGGTLRTGGTGTSGQGNNGGQNNGSANFAAGGGGGAGAVGGDGGSAGNGNGGNGSSSSISGSSVTYAGGGGAGKHVNASAAGTGGTGGGGNGGSSSVGVSGTTNLGGGGGGGSSNNVGGAGGSGIVIISYAGSQAFNGGLVTSSGGNTIHTFTSTGALTPLTNNLTNSLRFRSSASAFLNRTPTLAGNRRTWTWSAWVKRGSLGVRQGLFSDTSGTSDTTFMFMAFTSSDTIEIALYNFNARVSTAVYRDPSAWYHIVLVADTSNATAQNRIRLYVNGNEVTAFSTNTTITQNSDLGINQNTAHGIGNASGSGAYLPFDGYMTDINFIDGQALEPYYFGNNDANGVWKPILYKGTYGTNGFYLPFTNNTTSSYAGGFNGSTQYLTVAGNTAFDLTGDFTIESWINPSSLPNPTGVWSLQPASGGAGIRCTYEGQLFVALISGVGTLYTQLDGPVLTANNWYHVAVTRSGSSLKLFVNGIVVATTSSSSWAGTSSPCTVGAARNYGSGAIFYYTGYQSNFRIVKGTALYTSNFVPSSSPLTSISGTSILTLQNATIIDNSTNAFTITNNGSVTTTTATPFVANITSDISGNANNWKPNNINYSASGTTYDAMLDVPTNTSATVANYAVMNPLWKDGTTVIAQGNLDVSNGNYGGFSTLTIPTNSKFYAEFTVTETQGNQGVGILKAANAYSGVISQADMFGSNSVTYYSVNGNKFVLGGGSTAYGSSWGTIGDVIGIAVDTVNNQITFYKNNTSQGVITGLTSGIEWVFATGNQTNTGGGAWNFGQRPFSYTPPTDFVRLNTFNLPTPTILQGNQYMDATLWTGSGAITNTIVNQSQFKPDLIWIKGRSNTASHSLQDSNRGFGTATKLSSNSTNAENNALADATDPIYGYVTAANSNGFTVNNGTTPTQTNVSGVTYVGWQWQAGQGSTSSNTSGSITSTVSVNTTAGFSIVTYTGTGANATVGHGLGVAPKMYIVKARNLASQNWGTYHASMNAIPQNYAMALNLTVGASATSGYWNNTAPTSTTFSIGTDTSTNASGNTYVAYCWAEITGFSRFGSYTGNGSADGPFVYCGFRPKFVMVKRTDTAGFSWCMKDSSRSPSNEVIADLFANSSDAEYTTAGQLNTDFLSNGFKLRQTNANQNANGGTYIVMAFAENPFKNANAR